MQNQANWGLVGDSKLSVGANVSVDGRLSLYDSPVMNGRLVQGDPACPMIVG